MKHCRNCGRENHDEALACQTCGTGFEQPTQQQKAQLQWERIAIIQNEAEAGRLKSELEAKAVPHVVFSYYDSAFDGIFQTTRGWGYIEAPIGYRDLITGILADIRQGSAPHKNSDREKTADNSGH